MDDSYERIPSRLEHTYVAKEIVSLFSNAITYSFIKLTGSLLCSFQLGKGTVSPDNNFLGRDSQIGIFPGNHLVSSGTLLESLRSLPPSDIEED